MLPETNRLEDAAAVVRAVTEGGLLLLSDAQRPNAVQILTGQFPRGSWWKHPQADVINTRLEEAAEHPDVLLTKLLAGKATYVHRKLWPALLAVGSAREPWQMEGLSPGAARLLESLDAGPLIATDAEPISKTATKDLEARLLVLAKSVWADGGKHASELDSWARWATRVGCTAGASVPQSKAALEAAAARLGPPAAALPWQVSAEPAPAAS